MEVSSSAIRRGLKARETRRRSLVCSGGSRKIIIGCCQSSWVMISRTVPCAELKVCGSREAASTSSNRLRAQKS